MTFYNNETQIVSTGRRYDSLQNINNSQSFINRWGETLPTDSGKCFTILSDGVTDARTDIGTLTNKKILWFSGEIPKYEINETAEPDIEYCLYYGLNFLLEDVKEVPNVTKFGGLMQFKNYDFLYTTVGRSPLLAKQSKSEKFYKNYTVSADTDRQGIIEKIIIIRDNANDCTINIRQNDSFQDIVLTAAENNLIIKKLVSPIVVNVDVPDILRVSYKIPIGKIGADSIKVGLLMENNFQ